MRETVASVLLDPRHHHKTFYRTGIYRAKVTNVTDVQHRGRVQVRILHLHPEPTTTQQRKNVSSRPVDAAGNTLSAEGDLTDLGEDNVTVTNLLSNASTGVATAHLPWAEPAFPFGGKAGEGLFMLPSVGSDVWVAFEMGHTCAPVWLGGWYAKGELPPEIDNAEPDKVRLIKTPAGHKILLNDASSGPSVEIEAADSDVTITTQNVTITISEGGDVTIAASGDVNVEAAGDVNLGTGAALGVVLDSMITKFNTHTHAGVTSGGASTAVPAPLLVLGTDSSTTVKAKV